MKKVIVCLVAICAVLLFGGLNTVHAWPYLEVEGYVNPYAGTIVDNGTTTTFSDVKYSFLVTTASYWYDYWMNYMPYTPGNPNPRAAMNFLSLEMESDVFAGFGAITLSDPTDWSYFVGVNPNNGNSYEVGVAGVNGTMIGEGQRLSFTVEDVVVYNAALVPGNNLWQEGQQWGQSFDAGDTLGGNDGGSTTLIPEPGTLMLLGTGLAGLFYVRRAKVFNI